MNAERLEFIDERMMTLCVEQLVISREHLVISREHKECSDRDPVQGEREVGPPDTSEQ
jgi:hypothetical protein